MLSPAARAGASSRQRLRVLHIGNIANNAYINAKIQRRAGIDADVLCYDYFHVMGAPEWEDSDFEGDVGDDNFPDWKGVDLRGFRRPVWFAQGRARTCRRYLKAHAAGRRREARLLWLRLRIEGWLTCRRSRPANAARRLTAVSRPVRHRLRYVRAAIFSRLVRSVRRPARDAPRPTGPPPDPDTDLRTAYESDAPEWRELFAHYDVVQAYALDPAIPFVVGEIPYTAYEHGTLREFPFEDTPVGRLCAISYRAAGAVFVTNIDNLDAAERLGIDGDRLIPLPHAVDSDRLVRFAREQGDLRPPTSELRIFAPSRQDWVDADPNWTKGNDRLFRAVRAVVDEGVPIRVRAVAWGRDLAASKELVADLRLEEVVEWLPTMRKNALWAEYLCSHAVADQFVLAAFGGVTFEALALGRRVITSLDLSTAARFFGAPPPVLVASSASTIADALREVAEDPPDIRGRGEHARQWFDEHHSSRRIVELQVQAYDRLLGRAAR